MSKIYGPKSYNNYHYDEKRDSPYKVLGTTFNPYQPKISNKLEENSNHILGTSLLKGKTPQKKQAPYENIYDKQSNKRSSSTAPLISNPYNRNSNPYSRSPNYNSYLNNYSNNRDHVKDLLNLTGRETITFYKPNNNNKNNYSRQNQYENKPNINNMKMINNYETVKNEINEYNYKFKNNNPYQSNPINNYEYKTINYNNNYNYNKYNNYNLYNNNYSKLNLQEKISNDKLEEYFEENCGNLIKNYAYKEYPNSIYRDYMEDKGKSIINYNLNPDNALFCLFDGHGGGEVSKFLQEKFPIFMKDILPINKQNAETKLKNLFFIIDNKLKENNFYQVGATACIVYITKENGKKILYCANIGDTRCILINDYGIERLSYDDRATDENEHNRIIKQGGIVFGGRVYGQLMLSRAFGDWELKSYGVISEPHINIIIIENSDKYIIIASDGVWDVLEDNDVFELYKDKHKNNTLELCRDIIKNSLDRGSMDNISCFVIGLN